VKEVGVVCCERKLSCDLGDDAEDKRAWDEAEEGVLIERRCSLIAAVELLNIANDVAAGEMAGVDG
jgi:hypothetical protein